MTTATNSGRSSFGTLGVATIAVTPFSQNCTFLYDTETARAVIVDPGGEAPRIADGAAARNLTVEAIWLTHGHLDHAGGAEELRGLLGGVPIIGPHRADQFLLEAIEQQAAHFNLPGLHNAMPDRFVDEGEQLTLGSHRFEVLHCPGHTPGHVVFADTTARFAQVGDVLFAGSVGRTDFPYGNHAQLIAAIREKLLPLGDDMRFVCGHGPTSNFGRERANNQFLRE